MKQFIRLFVILGFVGTLTHFLIELRIEIQGNDFHWTVNHILKYTTITVIAIILYVQTYKREKNN